MIYPFPFPCALVSPVVDMILELFFSFSAIGEHLDSMLSQGQFYAF